jgi:malonyl-CoA O-methyltransferase
MIEGSLRWIKANSVDGQGIIATSRTRTCYPEVTGYLIPTLLSVGERDLACRYAEWLACMQGEDGSFAGATGRGGYAFDTGQVVRGWVRLLDRMPDLERPLRRACDWLLSTSDPATGRIQVPPPGQDWSLGRRGEVNEAIHLHVLAPLRWAGELLNERRYTDFVDRALPYYLGHTNPTDFARPNCLTHFYAYVQEALLDLGCEEEARAGMANVARHQQPSGAVPGYHDVGWVCVPGLAQLALVWYRLGQRQRADAALGFLALLQNPSGGFFGSHGVQADYFPAEEVSWAAKYAIDAAQQRIAAHFDHTVRDYRPTISERDGRAEIVLRLLGDLHGKRVLDAGCGKGRYAALITQRHPGAEVTAIDISSEMLQHVPSGIRALRQSFLDLAFSDGAFDAVICIEALEHAVCVETAVGELARVLAPGGTLVIIDKNRDKRGTLERAPWEQWFGVEDMLALLRRHGVAARAEFVGHDGSDRPDGLFVCWAGVKAVEPAASRPPRTTAPAPIQAASRTPAPAPLSRTRAIRTFDPRTLLGDRLGLALYCLFVEAHLARRESPVFAWYDRFVAHFGEETHHTRATFGALIEGVRREGLDPGRPIYANPKEFCLADGSHRSATAIVLGIPDVPYHLRFQDTRVPDEVFPAIFDRSEIERLEEAQERYIRATDAQTAFVCRVRRILRRHPRSFAAPFSSRTRIPAVRPYQGSARLGILGKRSTERRLEAYGLSRHVTGAMRVLEIGCNCGFLALEVARLAAHVTAFDVDPAYIAVAEEARSFLGARNSTFRTSSVATFECESPFDVVISCAVHGWAGMDFAAYVSRVRSFLRPGGLLLFESHEIDHHPEWEAQKRHLCSSFRPIDGGWIDDVDGDLYESEMREFLLLEKPETGGARDRA